VARSGAGRGLEAALPRSRRSGFPRGAGVIYRKDEDGQRATPEANVWHILAWRPLSGHRTAVGNDCHLRAFFRTVNFPQRLRPFRRAGRVFIARGRRSQTNAAWSARGWRVARAAGLPTPPLGKTITLPARRPHHPAAILPHPPGINATPIGPAASDPAIPFFIYSGQTRRGAGFGGEYNALQYLRAAAGGTGGSLRLLDGRSAWRAHGADDRRQAPHGL